MNNSLKKILLTEQKVQKVYQQVNPSLYPKNKEKKNFLKSNKFLENLYFNYLKIPIEFLNNKTMLEFGSGTGEYSINYLLWNMKSDHVELNPIAIKKCKNYFNKFSKSKKYRIYNKSIFTFRSKKKYDFVSSIGVIHHSDYKKSFKIKCGFLKKKGFMMLGIGNAAGMFQRNLQRYIIYYLSNNNEKEMYKLTKYLFPSFLRRAQKYGRRTLDSIIYDNFINPKDFHPSTKEILHLAKQNNLTLHSSWPPLSPMFLSDSAQRYQVQIEEYRNIMSINDIFGLVHREDDHKKLNLINNKLSKNINSLNKLTKLINDIGTKKLPKLKIFYKGLKLIRNKDFNQLNFLDTIKDTFTTEDFLNFQNELEMLIHILKKKNKKLLKNFLEVAKTLFKGNSGIGMNYYMFYKK